MTARLGSRLLDNCKLDLINIPYNVQLKHDKRKLPYDEIFREMASGLANNLPKDSPIHTYPKIIIHRLGRKRCQEFAIMPIEDFKKILVILERVNELERKG